MNYRHLPLTCDCGRAPDRIVEVGFSADHQLVVHWWCEECQRIVYLTKPLAECWRECPGPDLSMECVLEAWQNGGAVTVPDETEADRDSHFLRSLGVSAL